MIFMTKIGSIHYYNMKKNAKFIDWFGFACLCDVVVVVVVFVLRWRRLITPGKSETPFTDTVITKLSYDYISAYYEIKPTIFKFCRQREIDRLCVTSILKTNQTIHRYMSLRPSFFKIILIRSCILIIHTQIIIIIIFYFCFFLFASHESINHHIEFQSKSANSFITSRCILIL